MIQYTYSTFHFKCSKKICLQVTSSVADSSEPSLQRVAQCAAAGMGSCPHAPVFSCTSPCSKTLKLHVPRKPGFSAGISQIYSILHHWKISFTIWIQRFRDWLKDIHKIVKLAKLI